MQRIDVSLRFGRTAKAVVAVLALGLILLAELCAASPSLHSRLHADRRHFEQFCVVCALATGQLGWAGNVPVLAAASVFVLYITLLRSALPVSELDFFSFPTRAPPRAWSSSAVRFPF